DLSEYSYDELAELYEQVAAEIGRRDRSAAIPQEIDALQAEQLTAAGEQESDQWRPWEETNRAYPEGWHVTYDGKEWTSLVSSNVWEPPTYWREVAAESDDPPEWRQPVGAGDGYSVGDRVTFEGAVYESTID